MKQFFLLILFTICVTPVIHAQDSIRRNLGPNINTEFNDVSPIISPDGKILYYVIEGHPANTKSNYYSDTEDIWYSEKDVNGAWTRGKRMSKPFNMRRYNSISSISADGNIIYIRGAYHDGEYTGSGFSYVMKTTTGWSEPEAMNIKDYDFMSRGYATAMWMCPDGKTLILAFSKSSKLNYNDESINDLYVSFKTGPNQWAKPVYIKSINTKKFTESTPFMASDNSTLYFSSDRPGGKGGRDIWMTKRLDDTWKNWSAPINLDSNVNSSGWDGYYTLDARGEYAYMVSDKTGYGFSYDIVRIKLTHTERPNPTVLISGKVINAKTNQPVSARITYHSLLTGKEIGQAISDPVTGNYRITLPYGVQYSFNANGGNFIPVSNNIDLTTVAEYKEINQDLFLVPIEIGQTVQLNNIFFDMSKATLRPESYVELDKLFIILQNNPNMSIEIDGHTDNVGNPELNLKLSQDRSNTVRDYLINKGIVHTRITTKGFGGTKPIASNDTEETKKLNRRVEFTILKL
ncbi:OmpA family protein [Cytophaga aurantiaca]|uniref:OmpA family protein n=1 Tax=Cytophaga aurantiaca TaxID=29530 RepID=UPI00036C165C|nr:OmpA family protein [Cytophaga aurantiaca]